MSASATCQELLRFIAEDEEWKWADTHKMRGELQKRKACLENALTSFDRAFIIQSDVKEMKSRYNTQQWTQNLIGYVRHNDDVKALVKHTKKITNMHKLVTQTSE